MEKTIYSYQSEKIRLQIIVKNDTVILIKNRKKVECDYPYMENATNTHKIMHEFIQQVTSDVYNNIADKIASLKGIKGESIQGTYKG